MDEITVEEQIKSLVRRIAAGNMGSATAVRIMNVIVETGFEIGLSIKQICELCRNATKDMRVDKECFAGMLHIVRKYLQEQGRLDQSLTV